MVEVFNSKYQRDFANRIRGRRGYRGRGGYSGMMSDPYDGYGENSDADFR